MHSVPLQCLSLKFSYHLSDYPKDPNGIGESLKQMDLDLMALRIAQDVGTLVYLTMEASWEPLWGVKLYWRLGRSEFGGVFATRMNREVGETAVTSLYQGLFSSSTGE